MKPEYKYLGVLKTVIVKSLWRNKRKTRPELVKELNYARSTIYDNLGKGRLSLLGRGIVERKSTKSGIGRPVVYWSLTADFINNMESEINDA